MALVINDRVKETTTTTGTGTISLGGAVTGFETFAAGIGYSNTVYYCIAHQDQAEFEVGLGTLDGDSSDLARTTIISSSNSDSAVDFSAGTKDVFCTIPASKMVFEDASDSVASITSLKNTSLVIGRDADNDIDFATDNNIIFRASGADQIVLKDGVLEPITDDDVALGTSGTKRFTNLFLSGAVTAGGAATIGGNLNLSGVFEIDVASGDPTIVLDTQGADKFHIAVDDSDSDSLVIKTGSTVGGGNGLKLDDTGNLTVTADVSVGDDLTVEGGVIEFKSNSGSPASLKMYCESSNAHFQTLQPQPHSASAANTLRLPNSGDSGTQDLVAVDITQTLTNKTLTTPVISEIDSGSSITLDATTDIVLDADGADVILKDGGTEFGRFTNSSTDFVMQVATQDKDILFKGDDGGSGITALTLDMSEAGNATFNGTVTADAGLKADNITIDGTEIDLSSGDLTLDVAGDIIFDADGADFKFQDGGTEILRISNSSSDVIIKPIVDAKDIIFQQRDGTEVMRIEDGAHMSLAAAAVNPEATLTDASTISWNVLTSPVAKVTLGANRTLGAGTGAITGQFVSLLVIQDGTGSRTLSFNAAYEFKDDTAPTLTTTASKGDLFVFRYNGSKFLEVGRNLNLTLS